MALAWLWGKPAKSSHASSALSFTLTGAMYVATATAIKALKKLESRMIVGALPQENHGMISSQNPYHRQGSC
jgi:hypothetical protein